MQIVLTLQSPTIEALKPAWSLLSKQDTMLLQNMIVLAAPWRNFSNIRRAMEAVEGTTSPCVPFIGLPLFG